VGALSFTRYQKDTFTVPVKLENPDGSAVDLTGAEVRFALAEYDEATDGVTVERNDAAGEITVSVHYTLMDALTPGENYRFGLVLIWPDDTRTTVLDGWIALQGKVVE